MNVRIGTRGSELALTQSNLVLNTLEQLHPSITFELVPVKTLGDQKQGTPDASQSDKKDWILELELAVLRGDIELAIHSGKDVPCDIEAGTTVHSALKRATPFDIFISQKNSKGTTTKFSDLPSGSIIGTASLRRQAQVLLHRPDLKLIPHRGNVPTRLRKLFENNELSGIIIAAAGVERLNLKDFDFEYLKPPLFLPALNQGTLCVQFAADNTSIKQLLAPLIDAETETTFRSEREVANVLQGDCKSAIAIYAETNNDTLTLSARVMTPDGSREIRAEKSGPRTSPTELGQRVAEQLLAEGAPAILEESRMLDLSH